MDISTERHGAVLIARAEGRVDGSNAQQFHQAVESALGADDLAMALDFSRLSYISSAGLRVVLLTAKTLQQRRGRLVVCSLPNAIRELFQISGFDKIITICESCDEAVAELNGS